MNKEFQIFSMDLSPVNISLIKISSQLPTWDDSLQLIFVSKGFAQIQVNNSTYNLSEEGMLLISPMEVYSLLEGNGIAVIFRFNMVKISGQAQGYKLPEFHAEYLDNSEYEEIEYIRRLLAAFIARGMKKKSATYTLDNIADSMHIISLITKGLSQAQKNEKKSNTVPLLNAISYTVQNFNKDISVTDAAAVSEYSVSHFSKIFSEFTGCTFLEYLTLLRLREAERMLGSGMNMSDIAERCGFSDYRAFARAYQKKYHMTPTDGRKKLAGNENVKSLGQVEMPQNASEHLEICQQQLNKEHFQLQTRYIKLPNVSVSKSAGKFVHTWQQSIGGGFATTLMQTENQNIIRQLQKNIGYKNIILMGMLSDAMRIVYMSKYNEINYYFSNCDKVLDFVLSVDLKPSIQLGLMPRLLAKNKENYPYGRFNIVSLPEDINEWERLVRAFLEHLILRYGLHVVKTWEFHLWSKPEATDLPHGFENVKEYFEFYFKTYKAVKSYGPDIRFGSPAFLIESCKKPWIKEFFFLCRQNNCMPDSLNFDFYPVIKNIVAFEDLENTSAPEYNEIVEDLHYHVDPDFMEDAVSRITKLCREYDLPYEKAALEEWNFSISQRERVHDTCYMASYIAKNVLESWDKFSDICFWEYTDSDAQVEINDHLFHGGMGMTTRGNLEKPSCYAFWMLARLGDQLIIRGDGYIVTRQSQNIQVLFYNYCHYSELFANARRDYPDKMSGYEPFREQARKHISLMLTDLPNQEYMMITHRLNREHGSTYDNWIRMGGQELTAQDEFEYIRGISQPYLHKQRAWIRNGSYQIEAELEPFELFLIEINPIVQRFEEPET